MGVMAKTMPIAKGISLDKVKEASDEICENCEVSKSCRKPRKPADEESFNSTESLDLLHADVVGPINSESIAGKRYFIPLYDDSSAVSLVRFLWYKSEAGRAIKEMISDLETLRKGRVKQLIITEYDVDRVKRLRTDNAKDFMTKEFENGCKRGEFNMT